jgi:TATA-binding protein-associated factor Taf7
MLGKDDEKLALKALLSSLLASKSKEEDDDESPTVKAVEEEVYSEDEDEEEDEEDEEEDEEDEEEMSLKDAVRKFMEEKEDPFAAKKGIAFAGPDLEIMIERRMGSPKMKMLKKGK